MNNLMLASTPNLVCSVLAIVVMFALPALVIYLTKKNKFLGGIGAIALCYLGGFLLSLLPIPYDKTLTLDVSSILVALAIPMLLFTFDLSEIKKLAKNTIIAFALVIVATMCVSTIGYFVANALGMEHANQLAGMSTGLYIGGTPNLMAIGTALLDANDRQTVITAANTSDFVVGGIYFLLLLTVLGPLYRKLLDKKTNVQKSDATTTQNCSDNNANTQNAQMEYDYKSIPRDKKSIWKIVGVCALAIACLGIGALLEILINGNLSGSLFLMIAVSILGIAFSFVKPIRQVKGPYQIGQYLILIFSLGLSMSLDVSVLAKEILPTLAFFASVQIGSILLHLLLCKIFKIDSGTAIITSTAGVYGPPFIAPVANAYGDRNLIAPGIICGTVGLAIGNLLGISLGTLLAMF